MDRELDSFNFFGNLLKADGQTLVVFPRFDPGQYLQAIEKYESSVIGGAFQLFIPLVNHPDFKKYNLSPSPSPLPLETVS